MARDLKASAIAINSHIRLCFRTERTIAIGLLIVHYWTTLLFFLTLDMEFYTICALCLFVVCCLAIVSALVEHFPEVNLRVAVSAKKREFRI